MRMVTRTGEARRKHRETKEKQDRGRKFCGVETNGEDICESRLVLRTTNSAMTTEDI